MREKSTSTLLIWLTAIATPLQTSWAIDCGCSSGRARGSVPACCEASTEPGLSTGCPCGSDCQCAARSESPTPQPAPDPDNGRSQSDLALAVDLSLSRAVVPPSGTPQRGVEANSAFFPSGAQKCVLLCRFTL